MNSFINSLEQWYKQNGVMYCRTESVIWRLYSRMIVPSGPSSYSYSLSKKQSALLFKVFPEAIVCRYTTLSCVNDPDPAFYSVVCRKPLSMENIDSKRRSEIRRGLNNCRVLQADPREIVDDAYVIYRKSMKSYGKRPVSFEVFLREFAPVTGFENLINYWAVFYENKMIAWAKVYLFEPDEASISVIKFDDDYLSKYPSYALFYNLMRYYLAEKGCRQLSDGYRSLAHDTKIQEFLIRKFGFEKLPLQVHLHFKRPWHLIVRAINPLLPLFKVMNPQIAALLRLYRISIKQKTSLKSESYE